ncbi:cytosolic phospholipase A2 delta-like [Eleutherodactylus coqui]|uniref:cytosolic phospholipase A2 delta-like n=1 Tax=Eleutherodactylus coqui TaxID=57060 RepID=UPI0034632C2C
MLVNYINSLARVIISEHGLVKGKLLTVVSACFVDSSCGSDGNRRRSPSYGLFVQSFVWTSEHGSIGLCYIHSKCLWFYMKTESRLSDQQAALDNGQNPLPIYLAINVKQDTISTLDFKEWCEFTPYEVGLLKYGAFIRTQDFGSEFYMGQLMKKHPEPRICFLQGLWGNVFSLNLVDTYYLTTQLDTFWDTWVKDRIKDIDEEDIREKRVCTHQNSPFHNGWNFQSHFEGCIDQQAYRWGAT